MDVTVRIQIVGVNKTVVKGKKYLLIGFNTIFGSHENIKRILIDDSDSGDEYDNNDKNKKKKSNNVNELNFKFDTLDIDETSIYKNNDYDDDDDDGFKFNKYTSTCLIGELYENVLDDTNAPCSTIISRKTMITYDAYNTKKFTDIVTFKNYGGVDCIDVKITVLRWKIYNKFLKNLFTTTKYNETFMSYKEILSKLQLNVERKRYDDLKKLYKTSKKSLGWWSNGAYCLEDLKSDNILSDTTSFSVFMSDCDSIKPHSNIEYVQSMWCQAMKLVLSDNRDTILEIVQSKVKLEDNGSYDMRIIWKRCMTLNMKMETLCKMATVLPALSIRYIADYYIDRNGIKIPSDFWVGESDAANDCEDKAFLCMKRYLDLIEIIKSYDYHEDFSHLFELLKISNLFEIFIGEASVSNGSALETNRMVTCSKKNVKTIDDRECTGHVPCIILPKWFIYNKKNYETTGTVDYETKSFTIKMESEIKLKNTMKTYNGEKLDTIYMVEGTGPIHPYRIDKPNTKNVKIIDKILSNFTDDVCCTTYNATCFYKKIFSIFNKDLHFNVVSNVVVFDDDMSSLVQYGCTFSEFKNFDFKLKFTYPDEKPMELDTICKIVACYKLPPCPLFEDRTSCMLKPRIYNQKMNGVQNNIPHGHRDSLSTTRNFIADTENGIVVNVVTHKSVLFDFKKMKNGYIIVPPFRFIDVHIYIKTKTNLDIIQIDEYRMTEDNILFLFWI
jgi:hypothetical protein